MLQVVALTWDALVYASAVAPLLGPGVFQPLEHGRGFGTRAEKKRAGGAAVCGAQADAQRGPGILVVAERLVHWLRLSRRAGATPAWPYLLAEGGTNRGGL